MAFAAHQITPDGWTMITRIASLPNSLLRASHRYRFQSTWRVQGRIEELADLLLDTDSLPCWWPSAFFEARTLKVGNDQSEGRVFDLVTRGWLPYTLRFRMRVKHTDYPRKFVLVSTGDFVGRAVGRLYQDSGVACVNFDWRLRVRKPLLRWLSPIARPVLKSNHYWMMRRGQESLGIEIHRRRMDLEQTPSFGSQNDHVSFLGFRAPWPRQIAAISRLQGCE